MALGKRHMHSMCHPRHGTFLVMMTYTLLRLYRIMLFLSFFLEYDNYTFHIVIVYPLEMDASTALAQAFSPAVEALV